MAAKNKEERRQAAPVYLVHGTEDFEVGRNARELVDALCPPAEQDFGLEIVNGKVPTIEEAVAALNKCISALMTVGFFGGGRTVWLRDATFLATVRGGAAAASDEASSEALSEDDAEAGDEAQGGGLSQDIKDRLAVLNDLIKKGLPEGQKLVISAGKINKSLGLYKSIAAAGEVREFSPSEKQHEAERASEEQVVLAFREAGLKPGPSVLEVFLDRSGGNTRQIRNEVEKLSLFMGDRKEVRVEDVTAIVSPSREAIAWDLSDAFTARNLPIALATLRHLLSQKTAPQLLIAVLESRLRDMILLRQCIDRRWLRVNRRGDRVYTDWQQDPEADAVLGRLDRDPRKMHWFPLAKIAERLHLYTSEELVRAHRLVTEAHERMVSAPVPADILIEHLLVAVMRGGRRATA